MTTECYLNKVNKTHSDRVPESGFYKTRSDPVALVKYCNPGQTFEQPWPPPHKPAARVCVCVINSRGENNPRVMPGLFPLICILSKRRL